MRRSVLCCLLVGLMASVVLAEPNSASMPAVWRYAHPDATALVGIEWNRVLRSPLGQQIQAKVAESGFSGTPGLEFMDDVDRIFISSPGSAGLSPGEQPPAVVAVQGRFDLDKLRQMAAEKMPGSGVYRSVEVLEEEEAKPGERPTAMALVSPQTILLGDSESVRAAIDNHVMADSGQMQQTMFLRAMELSGNNDLWVVTEASLTDFSPGGTEAAPFLQDVDSIEAGISLQQGLGLEVNLSTRSPETAQNLAGGLQFILSMMLADKEKTAGLPDLTERLTVETFDTTVRMAVRLDQAELERAFESAGGGLVATGGAVQPQESPGSAGDWGAPQTQQPPPEPRKQVITIVGMDEGTREIPFGK